MQHKKFVPQFTLLHSISSKVVTLNGLSLLPYGCLIICILTSVGMYFLPYNLQPENYIHSILNGLLNIVILNLLRSYSKNNTLNPAKTGIDKIVGLLFCLGNLAKNPAYFGLATILFYLISVYRPWPLRSFNLSQPSLDLFIKSISAAAVANLTVQLLLKIMPYSCL